MYTVRECHLLTKTVDVVKKMTKVKFFLNNIFPAGICDQICNYNLRCSKCKELNDKARRYITFNYHFDHFEEKELRTKKS